MGAVLGFGLSTGDTFYLLGAAQHTLALLVGVETCRSATGANPYRVGGLHRIDGNAFHVILAGACTNGKNKKDSPQEISTSLHLHCFFKQRWGLMGLHRCYIKICLWTRLLGFYGCLSGGEACDGHAVR